MREKDVEILSLPIFLGQVLNEIDSHVREISYYHLKGALKTRYGLKCSLKDVERILGDPQWALSAGWGRGGDRLYRLSEDMKAMINQAPLRNP